MPVDLWFPLALYYDDLPESAAQKDAYVRYVYEALDQPPLERSYAWTGDVHGHDRIHEDPRFGWLTEAVGVHAWRYIEALGHDVDDLEIHIQRAWPVISRPGQGVAGHSHSNAHLSAVYWIAASDDSGRLRFSNKSRQNELSPGANSGTTAAYREFNPLNYGASEYEPVEGRLILFPSKQRHEVLANDSDADRLSISFDLVLSTRWDRPGAVHEFLMPPPEHWRRVPRPAPGPEIRVDRPMALAALSRDADALDAFTLPSAPDHPLWRSTVYPHCGSRQDWLDEQRRHAERADEKGDDAPGWRALPATAEGWSTFRNCVDRVHHHLAHAGVATLGATVTAPSISTGRITDDAFARSSTHAVAYLRLDHGDSAVAVEFAQEVEVVSLEPGSLAIVSGYRRHRLIGDGMFFRFGIDVPTLARPSPPDALRGISGPVDNLTAFSMATALPLTEPCPSSEAIDRKLVHAEASQRRRYRHEECPVVRAYLMDGVDPGSATDEDKSVIQSYGGEPTGAPLEDPVGVVRHVRLLDGTRCDQLVAFGRQRMRAIVPDSVDDLPEYQVNLDVLGLRELVGDEAVDALLALPAEHGAAGVRPHSPPPVHLFLRLFSPETRTYITFHTDVSCWTVNVPLDDEEPDSGGRLLMLCGGALRPEARVRGVALSHPGEIVHGVSRIKAGERWSLIALFQSNETEA